MDFQDKYDKLTDFIDSLELITDDLQGEEELKDYYYGCLELINQAEKEKEEIEPRLQEEYDRELNERVNEYWRNAV